MARRRKMKDLYYIFIEGVHGNPESSDEWTDRAEAYVENFCSKCKATRLEYKSDLVFRRMGQEERVDNLETILKRLDGHKIVLVAHSNGGDIVERLMKRKNFFIEEIHLIASASEKDFEKNGFNRTLTMGIIKKIFVYWSKKDAALKKAKWSSFLLSWLGLGYGYLGLVGPKNVDKAIDHRVESTQYDFGHSDYFDSENFGPLMKKITGI